MQQRKYTTYVSAAGGLTTLAGLLLYWRDTGGLHVGRITGCSISLNITQPYICILPEVEGWITSGFGLALTIGGLAAIAKLVLVFAVTKPTVEGLAALGKEIQAGGKPPTPEQMARLQGLQRRMSQALMWTTVLLVIAVAGMAVARYL
ncbi:MAG: hypothetical protein IT330_03485 [Anaerolineae bacterium]|nr:hypothetical protein [Anaerolineae bacterium]